MFIFSIFKSLTIFRIEVNTYSKSFLKNGQPLMLKTHCLRSPEVLALNGQIIDLPDFLLLPFIYPDHSEPANQLSPFTFTRLSFPEAEML